MKLLDLFTLDIFIFFLPVHLSHIPDIFEIYQNCD